MPSFLSGRTIMVTGATSGIGYETARLLAWSAGFRLSREYVHYATGPARD